MKQEETMKRKKNMEATKVYKFRPLGSNQDFERAETILRDKVFYCSRYTEMNDPMEGVYEILKKYKDKIKHIFEDKYRLKICSFSGEEAFGEIPLWGYYANGFKGFAIEVKVNSTKITDRPDEWWEPVDYVKKIQELKVKDSNGFDSDALSLLRTKLKCWEHESEYRFLMKTDTNFQKIGKITALYFGDPHRNTINRDTIEQYSKSFKDYLQRQKDLLKIAKDEKIPCYWVKIVNGHVQSGDEIDVQTETAD